MARSGELALLAFMRRLLRPHPTRLAQNGHSLLAIPFLVAGHLESQASAHSPIARDALEPFVFCSWLLATDTSQTKTKEPAKHLSRVLADRASSPTPASSDSQYF